MANKLILGASGYDKLALGYERNASQIRTTKFSVAATEKDGIVPGDLLATTDKLRDYKRASSASDTIAGIALATNVKVDTVFPQSKDETKFEVGDIGAALVYGEIAVKLHGNAPKEGGKVYYDPNNKAFTTVEAGNLAFPGARFTGETEGDVTVVFVQYI